ncbi:MAG: hypothetical protein PHC89_00125 [Candidatus Pacebacteria bacterium]|nr:hypothetical protein [Candidatus Paceibacterota bacterium]
MKKAAKKGSGANTSSKGTAGFPLKWIVLVLIGLALLVFYFWGGNSSEKKRSVASSEMVTMVLLQKGDWQFVPFGSKKGSRRVDFYTPSETLNMIIYSDKNKKQGKPFEADGHVLSYEDTGVWVWGSETAPVEIRCGYGEQRILTK